MTGANTISGTGRFVAATPTSQVSLGAGLNSGLLPAANFTNFGGLLLLNSSLALSGSLVFDSTGVLDLSGGSNCLTLGGNTLSVSAPIRGTSATAFVITNGSGGLTVSNSALSSYFFPIGLSALAYTPFFLTNSSTADIFTVRVRSGITNAPSTYPNFVNVEWVISQAGAGSRTLTLTPQWAAPNQQGTSFRTNAVGLGLFANNQYIETTTGASTSVPGGFSIVSGTYAGIFTSTPLVIFSRVQSPVTSSLQPTITGISPLSLPVSNEGFTLTILGTNLANIRTVTAQNLTNNASVQGTIVGTPLESILVVNFPSGVTNIAGTLQLSFANATATSLTAAQITVTPIAAPTISQITPSTTASGNDFTLNLIGTGFLSKAILTVNGNVARTMGSITSEAASLEVPAAANTTSGTLRIRLTNSDGQFAELPYTIGQSSRPSIANISPRAVFVGANSLSITVQGSGFFGQGFVTALFNATPVGVNVTSSTSLTLTVPANLLTQTGFPSILIRNSDGQSIGYVFTILERVPQGLTAIITGYSPTTTTASNRAFSVVVAGNNFSLRPVVTVRGAIVTPSALDTNRLIVEIPSGLNGSPGVLDITLQNPDLQFTIATVSVGTALPTPVLNSIAPLTTIAGINPGRPFLVTLSGTNFTTGASVILNGQVLQIISQSSTVIQALVPTNSISATSILQVVNSFVVLNSDGQTTSSAVFIVSLPDAVLENTLPGFRMYPNPVRDVVTIQGSFERPAEVILTIRTILGQIVFQMTEERTSGVYSKQIDISSLPVGSYLVEIRDGKRRFVQNVLK